MAREVSEFKQKLAFKEEENFSVDEIKKYIKVIQRDIMRDIEGAKWEKQKEAEEKGEPTTEIELSQEEITAIIQDYIEQYNNMLKFEGQMPVQALKKLDIYLVLEKIARSYPDAFSQFAKVAAYKEETKNSKNLIDIMRNGNKLAKYKKDFRSAFIRITSEEYDVMMGILTGIYRTNKKANSKQIMQEVIRQKNELEKSISIPRIKAYVEYLSNYGFIDEDIQEINAYLEKIGAKELKIAKRNPLGEEKVDKKTSKKVYTEDIGVIDFFGDDSELLKLSEQSGSEELGKSYNNDLLLMEMSYCKEYDTRRERMSTAMAVIKMADLWKEIVTGEEKAIDDISDERIKDAQVRENAITHIYGLKQDYKCAPGEEKPDVLEFVTPAMKGQYTRFLKEKGIEGTNLIQDVQMIAPEMENLDLTYRSLCDNSYKILARLRDGQMKDTTYGTIDTTKWLPDSNSELVKDIKTIVVDSKRFRSPTTIEVLDDAYRTIFGNVKIPEYEKPELVESGYVRAMNTLLLPKNPYIDAMASKLYARNPQEPAIAYLAGKELIKKNSENPNHPEIPEGPEELE